MGAAGSWGEKHLLERWGRRYQWGQGRLRGVWLGGHRPGHWVQRLGREWTGPGSLQLCARKCRALFAVMGEVVSV